MDSSHTAIMAAATTINTWLYVKSNNAVAEGAKLLDQCIAAVANQVLSEDEADPCANERTYLNNKTIELYAVTATFVVIVAATTLLCCKRPAKPIKAD